MKKSLLVLAVAAAVPVLAQAQTNVTMYGRMDAAIASEKNGIGSAILVNQGVQSTSRWGVRGAEDLGGGLKAVFNLEAGIVNDVGFGANASTGLDFRRRSVVGLEGGFGSILLGRDYDPLFRVLLASDTLGLGHYGNVHTIFGATGNFGAGGAAYGVRIDNGIHFVSPSLGGFVIRGAYGFSENQAGTIGVAGVNKNAGRAMSFAGEYAAGPLYVGVGYRANTISGAGTLTTIPGSLSNKYLAVGARYNFGAFAINGGYGRNDLAGGTVNDVKSLWVGADAQVGPGRLHAQFGRIDPTGAGRASSIGVTYNYPLSKRTNAYATLGQVSNSNTTTTNYSLGYSNGSVATGGAGKDPRGIAFGIGHNF
jgi:predicted porin